MTVLGPHRAALMNSLGDALKAADQHAKAEAIGQADMFGVLAEEPEQIEQSYASCQPWPEQVVLMGKGNVRAVPHRTPDQPVFKGD